MTNKRRVLQSLAVSAAFIAFAVALKVAQRRGLIDQETSVKALQVLMGLMLAAYANFIPKSLGTFRNPAAAERMQAALRTGGIAFVLGGLGYAVTSALPVPSHLPLIFLGTATAYVLGYSIWAFATCPRSEGSAPQS